MAGLALLALITLWGFICYQLSKFLMKKIANPIAKNFGIGFLLLLFFLVPVADDIAGGFQFRALCKENAVMQVESEKLKGKTVISLGAKSSSITDYLIPIKIQHWSYKDVQSEEILISWNDLHAEGGWLSHIIGFPEGSPPYTFDGSCYAEGGLDYVYNNSEFKLDIRK